MVIKFILVFTFRLFVMIDQDSGSCFEIKQECEDDLLEIVDNLKQEETEEQSKEALCSSSKDTDSMQKETKCENFIIVSNDAESTYTNIKQECDEEDPLNIANDFDLKQEVQTKESVHKNLVNQHICAKCEKQFASYMSLRRHFQTIHEKLREFNCDKCGKSFARKSNLNTHIKRVHGKFRYNCEKCCHKCEKHFTWKDDLNRHIQSVHET